MTHEALLDALDRGATVVTANRRLAQAVAADHARRREEAGAAVWESPDVLPLDGWLRRCFEDSLLAAAGAGVEIPVLLSPLQTQALWEGLIRKHADEYSLLSPGRTAALAADAFGLLRSWRIGLDAADHRLNEDARAFCGWMAAYEAACDEAGWLDPAALPALLTDWVGEGIASPPAALILYGFDELSPALAGLVEALGEAGCAVDRVSPARVADPAVRRVALPGAEEEVLAAAAWARAVLEDEPGARVGIVVPDLAARRGAVERALDEALEPERLLDPGAGPAALWNLSLGRPLAAYPVVHDALLALRGTPRGHGRPATTLTLAEMGTLLRSPFLGEAEAEREARAALDARLRQDAGLNVRWQRVAGLAAAADRPWHCPRLAARVNAWVRAAAETSARALPSRWGERFAALLATLGWPGERALGSTEHQAVSAWGKLLGRLGGLDPVLGPVDLDTALGRLNRLAAEQAFQPESPEAPVQVLGVLEAAGLRFDALWVTGLHDEAWPRGPEPNPFIPLAVQRRHGLPRSTPERELEMARRYTADLVGSAPRVVLSHPLAEAERELRASPLVLAYPALDPDALRGASLYAATVLASADLETFSDERGPPVPAARARGGSGIVTAQSACPFQAFARFRLGARGLGEASPGLDPLARGQLAHEVLEAFWREQGHELLDWAPERLEARTAEVVEGVIETHARDIPGPRLQDLERQRLGALVRDWLEEVERRREGDFSCQVEWKASCRIGGLELELRLDRVDVLDGGERLIIDYKTGRVSPKDWEGERPREPQLLLYALAHETDSLAGIAFARLRAGELGYTGRARREGLLPRVKADPDWDDFLDTARAAITRLAEDYRAGVARVDPLKPSQTCAYCELGPLCRIHERAGPGEDDGEDPA